MKGSGLIRSAGAVAVSLLALWTVPCRAPVWGEGEDVTPGAFQFIERERERSGSPSLERRTELDGVAMTRAREVAGLAADLRVAAREPIRPLLDEAGVRPYRTAVDYLDVRRDTTKPEAFARLWRTRAPAWDQVMDPAMDGIGLAGVLTDDGKIVFVAVLVDDQDIPGDLGPSARRLAEMVNALRTENDAAPLEWNEMLAEVARSHSDEMIRLDYFGQRSPSGEGTPDRVRARGLSYWKIAQNIARTRNDPDPVRAALDQWTSSESARAHLLDPHFTDTGVGVAVDEKGTYYFTQVLLTPR